LLKNSILSLILMAQRQGPGTPGFGVMGWSGSTAAISGPFSAPALSFAEALTFRIRASL